MRQILLGVVLGFVRQPQLSHHEYGAQLGHEFLGCVGGIAEPCLQVPGEPAPMPGRVSDLVERHAVEQLGRQRGGTAPGAACGTVCVGR